jgi:hypothetical protein
VAAAAAAPSAAAPSPVSGGITHPALGQPFDLAPLPNGHLIVTDLPNDAVFDLDPAHRSGRLVARIDRARELQRPRDGRVLVSSGSGCSR